MVRVITGILEQLMESCLGPSKRSRISFRSLNRKSFGNFCNVFVWALSNLLVVLGFLVFWPIIYKPLWNILYWDLSIMKQWVFISSLEVLLRTTGPYLWIFDSKWQIFLTYLGTSSKWRDFNPFRKTPNWRPPFSPIFVLGFILIFIRGKFHLQIRDDPTLQLN